uniref:NADPH oxidase activator 1 n=1 Tax=Electrophorus electricus TaxID=8005 RepID=A0A4W4GT66_ELEEL
MLYTELIRLWDEAVRAVDAQDLHRALASLNLITEPTSRTLFVTAAVHLSLRQIDLAIKALDQVIAKDERLAVGFFQRAAVHMMANRLEEALRDCMWAQKYMRDNAVIDYKQLGLRYKLYSWQVLYNAAAVYCRMNQWEKAEQTLLSASQERGGRGSQMDSAMSNIARREVIVPLMVPEGLVFRPRKQDVEELHPRDFLGKAEVILLTKVSNCWSAELYTTARCGPISFSNVPVQRDSRCVMFLEAQCLFIFSFCTLFFFLL